MHPPDPPSICTTCPTHVDNCRACFGWGFSEGRPITADRAYADQPPAEAEACAVCGGSLPKAKESEDADG